LLEDDDEARALLLSIDPLAALAQTQEQIHQRLLELTPTIYPELEIAWRAAAAKTLEPEPAKAAREAALGPAQFLLVLTCRDEKQQVELLARFRADGIECKALVG
jgi:hypothetical protein